MISADGNIDVLILRMEEVVLGILLIMVMQMLLEFLELIDEFISIFPLLGI